MVNKIKKVSVSHVNIMEDSMWYIIIFQLNEIVFNEQPFNLIYICL